MTNFGFVQVAEIAGLAKAAEKTARTDPRSSCIRARIALEAALHWMFDHDDELRFPYEKNLNAYLKEASFKETTPPHIQRSCELIRRVGNQAAHEVRAVQAASSRSAVAELHKVLYWFTRVYFDADLQAAFDPDLIPSGSPKDAGRDAAKTAAEEWEKKLAAERELRSEAEAELAVLRAQVAANKVAAVERADTHEYSEAETRAFYIDLLLAEAGWKVGGEGVEVEYPLVGVKRNAERTGTGYADYVLFGDDGKPLAVVEAKRTSVDVEKGQHQAADYADALEARFGRRPLIYYTNGYDIYFWDDAFYPPRQVAGFGKREELELAVQRRETRQPIAQAPVNKAIADRPYQVFAIRAVASHFQERHRRALVVMATGTGKTRTAIALVELLQKASWVKRVLFLCDRDSLLIQTKRAFAKHLPNTPAVDLRSTRTDTRARVCLSTYATMMNLVDEVEGGQRPFSPFHFDLIIIDEAHRSIYQKYQALFSYFDGLLLGLTATPRSDVDRNTYQLFELEDKNPTYAFELDEAVAKEYLVPYEALAVSTSFTRAGIKYADLSEREKEEYENLFSDPVTGDYPAEIASAALNRWLFNKPTVESFIRNLMEAGIKIEGGDLLGKTIVFALSTDHAIFIVKCFDEAFPRWAGKFCARIDYSLGKDAQPLIDKFSDPASLPMIAVSVDMLDTGIDIPEVVNLVFAKPVYSQVKFWQMIGRGTRLRPNLFGPGTVENPRADDKTRFLIMDYCGNLDFFAANPGGKITRQPEPLSSRLFKAALALSERLKKEGEELAAIGRKHRQFCVDFVAAIDAMSFVIRPKLRYVEKYQVAAAWDNLKDDSIDELWTHVAPLPSTLDLGDESARRWDLLLMEAELLFLDGSPRLDRFKASIQVTAKDLSGRASIPEVRAALPLLTAVCTEEYWAELSLEDLERIREGMRDLLKFIESDAKRIVYSNLADSVDLVVTDPPPLYSGLDLTQYRKRMDTLLEASRDHLTIAKLRRLVPLTPLDLAELDRLLFEGKEEEREVFIRLYGDKSRTEFEIEDPPISLLIRSIVGLDRAEVEKKLAAYINISGFNPHQLAFIDKLVDFFVRDGFVPVGALYEPPFDQYHEGGPEKLFGQAADRVIEFVRHANALALSASDDSFKESV